MWAWRAVTLTSCWSGRRLSLQTWRWVGWRFSMKSSIGTTAPTSGRWWVFQDLTRCVLWLWSINRRRHCDSHILFSSPQLDLVKSTVCSLYGLQTNVIHEVRVRCKMLGEKQFGEFSDSVFVHIPSKGKHLLLCLKATVEKFFHSTSEAAAVQPWLLEDAT